jgi:hypothetical protein
VQVRAPLQNISSLVNSVAERMGIGAELCGGGSGRGIMATDYIIRRRPPTPLLEVQRDLSADVLGCIEVKGEWQVDGREGPSSARAGGAFSRYLTC